MLNKIESSKLTKALFLVYFLLLVWIIIGKLHMNILDIQDINNRSINLIPFKGCAIVNGKIYKLELIINILLFIPLGIFMQLLFAKKFYKNILFILFVSISFEMIQYFLMIGVSDITDVMMNLLGGMVGLGIIESFQMIFDERVQTICNICAFGMICICLPFLLFISLMI